MNKKPMNILVIVVFFFSFSAEAGGGKKRSHPDDLKTTELDEPAAALLALHQATFSQSTGLSSPLDDIPPPPAPIRSPDPAPLPPSADVAPPEALRLTVHLHADQRLSALYLAPNASLIWGSYGVVLQGSRGAYVSLDPLYLTQNLESIYRAIGECPYLFYQKSAPDHGSDILRMPQGSFLPLPRDSAPPFPNCLKRFSPDRWEFYLNSQLIAQIPYGAPLFLTNGTQTVLVENGLEALVSDFARIWDLMANRITQIGIVVPSQDASLPSEMAPCAPPVQSSGATASAPTSAFTSPNSAKRVRMPHRPAPAAKDTAPTQPPSARPTSSLRSEMTKDLLSTLAPGPSVSLPIPE